MKKIFGVVVIYNPNIDQLIENINQYIEHISILHIWQNSFLDDRQKTLIYNGCIDKEKITFVGDGTNQGLDVAYNVSLNEAIKGNYSWLLTMDQDSTWENFEKYIDEVGNYLDSTIRIFGPRTINRCNKNTKLVTNSKKIELVEYVISSGALYDTYTLRRLGGFAKGYFIDAIDEEICYRAKSKGINTAVLNQAYLVQEFGAYKKRKILWKEVPSSNYSPFRYYHIVRNHIWLAKSGYIIGKSRRIMIYNYIISPLVKVLLLEENKGSKYKAMMKGVIDGIFKTSNLEVIL